MTTSGDINGGALTADGRSGRGGPSAGGASAGGPSAGGPSGRGGPSAGGADAGGANPGAANAGGARRGGTRRLPQTGAAEVVVDATPEAVWAVLSDVTRIGEWSHECRGAEWLDGATAAAPGVRFRGRNKAGALVRWSRVCVIRAVDPPHEFVWETVGPPLMRDASLWRVRLDAVDGGTRIRQEFRILSMATWADRVVAAMIPAHRDRVAALEADLRRLGEVSAGGRRTS